MFNRVPPPDTYKDSPIQASDGSSSDDSSPSGLKTSQPRKEGSDSSVTANTTPPRHVSKALWEKFKALEKRTDEVTSRSTEKRIKQLQRSVMSTVQEQITHPDDLDILRQHDVKLGPPVHERQRQKRKAADVTCSTSESAAGNEKWQDIKQYLSVNDHLQEVSHGDLGPKNHLEKKIDKAISQGDITTAESLSDSLAAREFGTKIAGAIDAKNYIQEKKKEEESMKAKRKKSLHWGFSHKQRWETKGNM